MTELRELQRKLDSVNSLSEVVNAMRNLAAIYVRRAETTLQAIRPYSEVIETALDVVLDRSETGNTGPAAPGERSLAIVFASDQGLCGTYNDRVVRAALEFGDARTGHVDFIAVGRRASDILAMRDRRPVLSVPAPTSLEGIRAQVPELAADVFEKYSDIGATEMFFVYNVYEGMGRFREQTRQVLPPKRKQLEAHRKDAFRYEPILTAPPTHLLGTMIEEYFFIELYRALLESHCSENGARLLSMTSAASNIDDRLLELTHEFQSTRQDVITAELLDVVGGAEALRAET